MQKEIDLKFKIMFFLRVIGLLVAFVPIFFVIYLITLPSPLPVIDPNIARCEKSGGIAVIKYYVNAHDLENCIYIKP